ncbi:hypothetical protein DICVIV_07119 [Dictyocaulus viviparus]|uniref:Uncharacterized protein n=1 Tax=Dictyocaulus viviparus TaxID=29172 RepID=A0A0D8XQ77_DICVI|nr:hypothetical protein DICVIV_07119 [Dictyocaulus viviparus]
MPEEPGKLKLAAVLRQTKTPFRLMIFVWISSDFLCRKFNVNLTSDFSESAGRKQYALKICDTKEQTKLLLMVSSNMGTLFLRMCPFNKYNTNGSTCSVFLKEPWASKTSVVVAGRFDGELAKGGLVMRYGALGPDDIASSSPPAAKTWILIRLLMDFALMLHTVFKLSVAAMTQRVNQIYYAKAGTQSVWRNFNVMMDIREFIIYFIILCLTVTDAIRCKCTKESETVTCVDGVCEVEHGYEFKKNK